MTSPHARVTRLAALVLLGCLGLSSAGEAQDPGRLPNRCEAVFIGPSGECVLSGTFGATGHGRNRAKAEDTARARLVELMDATTALRLAASGSGDGTLHQGSSCALVAEERATLQCEADPDLQSTVECFASYTERDCWTGGLLELSGPGWKVQEKGKDLICDAMEEALVARGVEAEHLARCRVGCLMDAAVRCSERPR